MLEPQVVTRTVVQTKYVYVIPPEHLIKECSITPANVGDNTSLLDYSRYLEKSVDICNTDIKKIQQWIIDNDG